MFVAGFLHIRYMRLLLRLFVVLFAFSSFAQESISYVRDVDGIYDFESIKEAAFAPITDPNKGLENGVYWFKISQIDHPREMLTIPSNHARILELRDDEGQHIYAMANTRYPSFFLIDRLHNFPLYLKANFTEEAFFPVQSMDESTFTAEEKYDLLGTGIFYGAIISLIFSTLVFYFITQNRVFLFHALLAVVVTYTIVARDNLFYLSHIQFPLEVEIELFSHFLVGFLGFCFAYFYLKLKNNHKVFKMVIVTLIALSAIAMCMYFITENMLYYFISDLFTVSTILMVWILGMLKTKNRTINWIIGAVYAFNIFLMLEVFVLHSSGNTLFGLTIFAAKICVILDVFLITFAMMFTFKKMQLKESLMKQQIKTYLQRIETLDQYKKVQDTNDSYLETLISEFGLTNIEVKVLQGISKGHSNEHIANYHNMNQEDVILTTKSLYGKLGIEADKELQLLVS